MLMWHSSTFGTKCRMPAFATLAGLGPVGIGVVDSPSICFVFYTCTAGPCTYMGLNRARAVASYRSTHSMAIASLPLRSTAVTYGRTPKTVP